MIARILFAILSAVAIYFFSKKISQIKRNILLVRDLSLNDEPAKRWHNVLLLALGQKKMFQNPLVAVLHLIIYLGFIIINLEVIEIILDGLLGTHRLFTSFLPISFYAFLIDSFELLALGVIVVCIVFLCRRHLVKISRFTSSDLDGSPRKDADYILITEIVLMSLFLTMNAADTLLQSRKYCHYALHPTSNFIVSGQLQGWMLNLPNRTVEAIERIGWWGHILGIFAFLNYLPYSKHLHILLAFPNAYFASLESSGKMENMPNIQQEVLYAMQPELAPTTASENSIGKFGAKDIFDLSWKNILDAYSCTECGRCSSACPATITGKKLSPRKIMMQTRDRVEAIGKNIQANTIFKPDDSSLLHDYITVEELRACTTCQACVAACPVSISPLDIIIQLRRYLILEESNAPDGWNLMYTNIENNFAPWKFSPEDRMNWAQDDTI